MSIFRAEHCKNYTVVNNTICSDSRLSWKAKGIWLYAFSKPDDWVFHLNDLLNQSTDGRDSVRAGLKELEDAGYLLRNQKKEKGQFSHVEWIFHETPQTDLKKKVPKTENPLAENQAPENHPLPSTDVLLSTEIRNINIPPPPTPPPFSGGGDGEEIFFIDSKKQKKSIMKSEVYMYFLKSGYSSAIIEEAIQCAKNEKGAVNNILKYLDAICLRLANNSKITKTSITASCNAPPKNTTKLSEAANLGDLIYGRK